MTFGSEDGFNLPREQTRPVCRLIGRSGRRVLSRVLEGWVQSFLPAFRSCLWL